MIELIDIQKSYDNTPVLKNISLKLPDKGLVSILGESGCGKSTLLSIIGGLERQNSGKVLYDNVEIEDMDTYRNKHLSYVFQDCFLFEDETVFNNLYYYLFEIGITNHDEACDRIHKVLKLVKLERYKKHLVKKLSGGEKQRLAVARALLRKNKVIFADEPTGNLDSLNARLIMDALAFVSRDSLVLLVTHNKEIAEEYSNEIYVIKDGGIINSYIPDGYNYSSENKLYLNELEKETLDNGKVHLDAYNLDDKLEVSFFSINGQIYYKSKSKINNLDDSPYKLMEKREDAKEKESLIDPISFDYNEVLEKRDIKKEMKLHYFIKNKTIILHRIFLCVIGVLFFFLSYFLVSSTTVDYKTIRYVDEAYMVNPNAHNDGKGKYLDFYHLNEGLINNKIYCIVEEKTCDFYLYNTLFVKGKKENAMYVPFEYNNKKVIYGADYLKSSKEIIISKVLADSLRGSIDYNDLIGYSVNINDTNKVQTIVGITDSMNYEAFYYNVEDLSVGYSWYKSLGENKKIYIVEKYEDLNIPLKEGRMPNTKHEIIALDDGKIELGDKAGDFIVSGIYELPDDMENKYEYVLSFESKTYLSELNNAKKVFNSNRKSNYLFLMKENNDYLNVVKEKAYQESAFNGKMHDKLVSYVIPFFATSILILGYLLLMSIIITNKKLKLFTFERVNGFKKGYILLKVGLVSLIDASIFIVLPYIISSLVFSLLRYANDYFNLGLSLLNPYLSIWFYFAMIILIAAYTFLFVFVSWLKLMDNPATLKKKVSK